MRHRLITFDIFNTIIRVRESPGKHYARVANAHGLAVEGSCLDDVYGPTWRDMKKEFPIYGIAQDMTAEYWWRTFILRLFAAADYSVDNHFLNKIATFLYHDFVKPQYWEILPHSVPILEKLKQNGIKVGVISNFDVRLPKVLEGLELDKYFDFLITSAAMECEKPNKTMFRAALKTSGTQAEYAAHVGDDLYADYWGARNAGIHSYLLNWSRKYGELDLHGVDENCVMENISELADICMSNNQWKLDMQWC